MLSIYFLYPSLSYLSALIFSLIFSRLTCACVRASGANAAPADILIHLSLSHFCIRVLFIPSLSCNYNCLRLKFVRSSQSSVFIFLVIIFLNLNWMSVNPSSVVLAWSKSSQVLMCIIIYSVNSIKHFYPSLLTTIFS